MSKKSPTNKTSFLSPENYIRQNSRNLPIGDCFINPDWETCRMCQVLITRKHITGYVTACMYLVDLSCLGVKDTIFKFNAPYEEIVEMFNKRSVRPINISYELAHNIIFAGLEFAEEYGFKPHKDFTSITSHFLEEDNDDIPLIEIECGMSGKPCYTNTGFDSPAREREILAQLERTAGKDNYFFMLPGLSNMYHYDNEDDYYDDDDDDEIDDLDTASEN